MDEPLHCYRHPSRETYVSCSECGRGICPDCMVFAPVGIRCPEHASVGAVKPNAARTVRQMRGTVTRSDAPVTFGLIAINVIVFVITLAQGSGSGPGGKLFADGALVGFLVQHGDWWRVVTAMFLHGSYLHIASNMLVLWLLGQTVEQALGSVRYLLLYFASGIAGSAGAFVIPLVHVNGGWSMHYEPFAVTVGASGAIWGIMGALLILEYMGTGSIAGSALTLIILNLAFSFAVPGISIGGHIGGLIGGALGTLGLVYTRYKRPRFMGEAIVVLVGVVSFAIAIARAKGTI